MKKKVPERFLKDSLKISWKIYLKSFCQKFVQTFRLSRDLESFMPGICPDISIIQKTFMEGFYESFLKVKNVQFFLKFFCNISVTFRKRFQETFHKYFMASWRIIQILCERLLQYFRNILYKFSRNFALIFHEILLNEKWYGHKNISEIFLWNISERFTVILRKIIPQYFWNISCQVFRLLKLFVKVFCNIWETFLTSFHETLQKCFMKGFWMKNDADIKKFLKSFCEIFVKGLQ